MRSVIVLAGLFGIAVMACGSDDNTRSCASAATCSQGGIAGTCLLSPSSSVSWCAYPDPDCEGSGARWGVLAGDGLASTCVVDDTVDGGVDSGGGDAADAAPQVDGDPGPFLINGQNAEIVLGQVDFESKFENAGGRSAASLRLPVGIEIAAGGLWGMDAGNGRVLLYAPVPTVSSTPAGRVLGQDSPTTQAAGPSQTRLGASSGGRLFDDVAVAGSKIVVSDGASNRVLIWSGIPAADGAPATLVLGQTTFTASTPGDAAGKFNRPGGVWTDGEKLAVADFENSRVLLWDTFPSTNGKSADRVLGWSSFGMGMGDAPASPPTARSMNRPSRVAFVDGRLYVSDWDNARIMVWNSWPAANNAAADFVVGRSSLTDGEFPDSAAINRISFPGGVSVYENKLFVIDHGFNRVLVFDPVPSASGASATYVIGAPDFTTAVFAETPSAATLSLPMDVVVAAGHVWVVDAANNRVLGFRTFPQSP